MMRLFFAIDKKKFQSNYRNSIIYLYLSKLS